MKMKTVLVLWTLAATVCGNEFEDDYLYEYEQDPNYKKKTDVDQDPPTFTASPQHFSVEILDDITFPCDVKNLGNQMMMFRHNLLAGDHKMLYVGNMSLNAKGYKLKKIENSFTLSSVGRRHAGSYECRVETSPVTTLNHTLNVKYPAMVKRISPEVQTVQKGLSVTLECKGKGNPKAAISWSRKQGHLPSGAQALEGSSLTFENVDRHVEGTYICTAANGIGDPSSTTMSIEVEYPPEIVAEQATIHSDFGDEAKLLCIVHGRPTPDVSWTRNGQGIDPNIHIQEHDGAHRHTLTITDVRTRDFGNYTCTAENNLGIEERTLRITGVPKSPSITSSPAGGERFMYTITWGTESFSPIIQYRLTYRKVKVNQTNLFRGGWNENLYSPPSVAASTPTVPEDKGPYMSMSHTLDGLEPATDYEVLVSVENMFGWSDESQVFRFHTRKEIAVGQSASGCQKPTSSTMLLITSLWAFSHRT